jgi:hypothetical protein
VVPGWELEPGDIEFAARCEELAAFRVAHGGWPSSIYDDPSTKRLARWLLAQQEDRMHGRMTKERAEKLDARFPGWEQGMKSFGVMLQELINWCQQNPGDWPSTGSTVERPLAHWLFWLMSDLESDRITSECAAELETKLSGLNPLGHRFCKLVVHCQANRPLKRLRTFDDEDHKETWGEKYDAAEKAMRTTGHWPKDDEPLRFRCKGATVPAEEVRVARRRGVSRLSAFSFVACAAIHFLLLSLTESAGQEKVGCGLRGIRPALSCQRLKKGLGGQEA